VFGLDQLWRRIEALDNQVDDAVQAAMITQLRAPFLRGTTWFLHTRRLAEPMSQLLDRLAPALTALRSRLEPLALNSARVAEWIAAGVPMELATRVAVSDALHDALDIAEIAEATGRDLAEVTELHFDLGVKLGLQRLQQQIDALPGDSYWENLAKIALGDDLAGLQRFVALEVLSQSKDDIGAMLHAWEAENQVELDGARRMLAELGDTKAPDLAMLSVALRKLRNLA
jgi:glutamate dehydrogenase